MDTTTRKTLKTLCQKVQIASEYGRTARPWDQYDEWQKKAHPYRVTLRYQRRSLTVDFWMGSANTSEPDAESVIDCLLSDAQSGELSFYEFCREFGYDEDSRKAEATWKLCKSLAPKIRRLLGSDFDAFLYSDR